MPGPPTDITCVLDREELGKNINADEAAAMGAVYQAAALSKAFKVKTFLIRDATVFPIQVSTAHDVAFKVVLHFDHTLVFSCVFRWSSTVRWKKMASKLSSTANASSSRGWHPTLSAKWSHSTATPMTLLSTSTTVTWVSSVRRTSGWWTFSISFFSFYPAEKTHSKNDLIFKTCVHPCPVLCSVFGSLNLTTVKLSGVGSSFLKHIDAESKGIKAHFNMDESGVLLLDRVSHTPNSSSFSIVLLQQSLDPCRVYCNPDQNALIKKNSFSYIWEDNFNKTLVVSSIHILEDFIVLSCNWIKIWEKLWLYRDLCLW